MGYLEVYQILWKEIYYNGKFWPRNQKQTKTRELNSKIWLITPRKIQDMMEMRRAPSSAWGERQVKNGTFSKGSGGQVQEGRHSMKNLQCPQQPGIRLWEEGTTHSLYAVRWYTACLLYCTYCSATLQSLWLPAFSSGPPPTHQWTGSSLWQKPSPEGLLSP